MQQMPEYARLSDEGARAYQMGQPRLAANKYVESFRATPSKWSRYRYHIFHGFHSIMVEKHFLPTSADLEFLETVMKDKSEPFLYRCSAAHTIGLLHWDQGQREQAAEFYRDAIHMGEKVPVKERNKKIMSTVKGADGRPLIAEQSVGDIVDELLNRTKDNLSRLENSAVDHGPLPLEMRMDGTMLPDNIRPNLMAWGPLPSELTPEQMGHMLSVGGGKCDCCGKTREEVGVKHFMLCSRCQKAYYCSAACQRKQWKDNGHKKYCRKPGEFKPGDYVRLDGLQAQPLLNGTIVQVIRPISHQPGRWETRMPGGVKSVSIAAEKMGQLRPLNH